MLRALNQKISLQGVRRASTYNQTKALRRYPIGQTVHGFEIKRVLPVPELSLTAVDFVHNKTGSNHLHIDRDDPNSVFSIGFKTNPPDKTGVPHILEHTTLCGSYKYPVRDPFFKMLNRSLANFMNAMTGHDYTFFPFSTTNDKDFENLRKVYLDSTFNPLLKKEDFFQEGWRLENEVVDDKTSPLTFKGVVYNEMKGQVSNASYLFYIKFQEALYPSLNNSGGDPTKITDLTYEDLLDFHQTNYHPSNAKTFTYGSLPVTETLEELNKEYLVFGKRNVKNIVKQPITLNENKNISVEGPVDPMAPPEKQLKASITWPCGNPEDVYESFCLKILSNLLTDGHSSPLYKSLIESGLGDDFSVNSGMDSTTAANFFTIGLQGLKSTEELEKAVNEVLIKHSEEGFEDKKIEAIIQQLELSKKDQKAEFGMSLLYSILPGWVNKVDPFDVLAWEDMIVQFKQDYAKGGLFENLIKKYFIDKPVFRFEMKPNEKYDELVKSEEAQRLKNLVEELDEEDRDIIFERGQHLAKLQGAEEDLSSLPTLRVRDIPRATAVKPVQFSDVSGSEVQKRITDTNGLTYFRGARDVNIPYELYPYLSLFSDALTNLGTETQSMADIEDQIKLYTGGLSSSVSVHSSPIDQSARISFNFNGVALNQNSSHIYEIWENLLLNTNFNNKEKLATLIRLLSSNNISGVAEGGHSYARNYAGASVSRSKAISESLSGIDQLQFLNKLNTWIQDDTLFQTNIIDKLNELKSYLVNSDGLRFSLISDKDSILENEKLISSFVSKLPSATNNQGLTASSTNEYPLNASSKSFIKLPFQVGYASSVVNGVPYVHEDGAKLQVLANLLTFKYLHREIREKGGAYGGGAAYSGLDGIFSYYSYRDPKALQSLDTFTKAGQFALDNKWTDRDLEEAKLTIFQSIDAPVSIKAEGQALFKEGVTDEMRQTRREQILDVDIEDLQEVAEKYLVNGKPSVAVVGNDPGEQKDWNTVDLGV
ncbi:putative metalloprotease [Wickerhamomyces ciferrii]|uniref:Presequence protease, mitochondrial n=1 Tax=Wickerhamomyces ciferrii (strain ATCC 14091 / BCRC 22168 / CBS 111 / JCM 3599 / NBRC 0793 / NRRL Y-1031 F-60-10) TaxID=1206466 RepID=K0KHK3_WICCF|nr:putative metalloprotease [Wickerhamomyces ciferrii]CCH40839.1 putative metalloprotease [Wickerhamomyces ciferrii]